LHFSFSVFQAQGYCLILDAGGVNTLVCGLHFVAAALAAAALPADAGAAEGTAATALVETGG